MAPALSKSIGAAKLSCEECWVTLAEDNRSAVRALVLAKSLRRVATTRKIAVVVCDDVSDDYRAKLQTAFDQCVKLSMPCERNGFPLRIYVKIFCWSMPFVRKCVFLDYDTMVLRNCDELFDYPGTSALFGKTGILDTSVMVYEPSYNDYSDLCNWLNSGKLHNVRGTQLDVQFGKWLIKRKLFHQLSPKFNVDVSLIEGQIIWNSDELGIVRFSGSHPIDFLDDAAAVESMNLVEKALVKYWIETYTQDILPMLKDPTQVHPMDSQKTSVHAFPAINQRVLDGNKEPIAIIGMSCRFPDANNLDEYWNILENGKDCIKTVPEHRWPHATSEEYREVQAGFLKCPVDEFDGKFFNISPYELAHTDPQQRFLLEVTWEALEHAGINPQSLAGTNTGVFVGTWTQDYRDLIKNVNGEFDDYHRTYMGNSLGGTSGRLSFLLGLNGPNIASESGCSSSMMAVYLAVESLKKGRCDIALAAGANLLLFPWTSTQNMLSVVSPDSRCKTFDESANGFGRAEGIATLVLKRYSDALKAGDNVLALIRGCGIAQEGTSRSFGTPTKEGQEIAMQAALEDAFVDPEEVSYVEAHGTGTVVGDVTEMAAIANLYCKNDRTQPLLVASGKTNIGHTESCSGIAGIIKVILAMQHETIPPHINLTNLNPHINLDQVPIRIPTKLEKWETENGKPRIAGISSFGITGTNAHVILQESPKYTSPSLALDIKERPTHIFTFSAKSEGSLDELLESYSKYVQANPNCDLADIAFTCNTGRAHFQYRTAITAGSSQELSQKLVSSLRKSHLAPETKPEVCFLFTGQGSQYFGMAETLYSTSPVFRMHFERCEKLLQNKYEMSIISAMWSQENKDLLQKSLYSQISIYCLEYCLMKLWESWGIRPDAVIGHSLGEFAAAVCAEILSFEDALELVVQRSRLIQEKAPAGQMIVVKTNKEKVDATLAQFQNKHPNLWLDYAAFNSPEQTVLAGKNEAVKSFANFIQQNYNLKTHIIDASNAFHSRDMDILLPEYRKVVSTIKLSPPKLTYISGVTGKITDDDEVIDASYWIRHTREPVNFLDAACTAVNYGCKLFLEIGPQPVLCALTMASCKEEALTLLPSIRRTENDWNTMHAALGKFYELGFDIDFARYDHYFVRRKVHLPTYPFYKKKYWYETKEDSQRGIVFNTKSLHPLLGYQIPNASPTFIFQSSLKLDKLEFLKDHVIGGHIVFPAAAFLEMSLSSGCLSTTGKLELVNPMSVENLTVEAPLGLVQSDVCSLQTVVSRTDNDDTKISIFTQKLLSGETGSESSSSIKWTRQAVASFVPLQVNYRLMEEMKNLREIKSNCKVSVDTTEFYETLTTVGLEFGTNFKSLKKLWRSHKGNEILTEIEIQTSQKNYLIHPVVLDALIQTIMIGINRSKAQGSLYVPLVIGKVILYATTQSQSYFAHCGWADNQSPDSRAATLYDPNGNIIATMEGVQMIETRAETIVKHLSSKSLEMPNMYEEVWRPRLGPMKNRTDLKVMNGENLFSKEFSNELATCLGQTDEHVKMVDNRRKLVYCYILKAFYELGWGPALNEHLDLDMFMSQLNILPTLKKLMHRYFDILYEEGILSKNPWRVIEIPPELSKVEQEIEKRASFINNHPQETGDALVTIGCGERLAKFLEGNESALSFLFPEDKTTKVCAETFYNESITVNAAHVALTSTLRKLMENYTSVPEDQRGVIRFLEIGAGTGSTTKHVLPIFDEFKAKFQYYVTDISPAFFIKTRQMFESYGQKIQYKVLNVEQDPLAQGFLPQHFDIVLASNVLHATRNLQESVRNVKSLLKEDGLLLLVETLEPIREYDVVFGLLDGFWRFEDYEMRSDYPCASIDTWEKVCKKEGYESYNAFPCFGGQLGVIVAKAASCNLPTSSMSLSPAGSSEGWWLVFADAKAFPNYLERMFYQMRRKLIIVEKSTDYSFNAETFHFHVRANVKADFINIFNMINESKLKIEGIAYLWGLDNEEDPLKITTGFLFLAQILLSEFKGLPKFVLATEGIMPIADESAVSITPSTLWGMVRSFRTEHFNLHVRSIDLDPDEEDLRLKYGELFSEFWNDDLEFQIAYRQRSRHVCRLVSCKDFATPLSLPNSERYLLKLPDTKNIADLVFCPNGKTGLRGNEVDVVVRATGLNFRDVFVVLKPESQFDSINCLGLEFAGIVVEAGHAVKNLRVGDRVMGCKFADGALPSHIQMEEDLLFKMPMEMTFCEAATIPAAFATAYYCLVMIGHLSKGETVLIHAASGGVGLFAIQIAKAVGAKIVATAGSRRKRAFLRNLGIEHVFHSRNTDYGEQIHSLTEGKGVHVILNSLTSPGFKEASLSVCSQGGRFIEMSKLHVWTPAEVKALRPDVDYNIVDLTTVDKDTWKSFWVAIDNYLRQGMLRPIPYTRFEATCIREALTYMQKAKHIGKIVIAQPNMIMKESAFEPDFKYFNDMSTYLVTGGLGGIGIELTKWMVKNGAKNIVLTSRRAPDENATKVITELQAQGNHIVAICTDVGDYNQCVELFKSIQDKKLNLPRLRGIFHCAGTLSDATYVNQSVETLQTAFHGKVYGARNLHLLTKGFNLEFFNLFSSMVSILGPIGLSNYAASNAYLDALCHYRNAIGLCGQSINWGQFSEVGAAKHVKMPAVKAFSPYQGLLALEFILKTQKTQIAVLDVDFQYVRKLTSNVGTYLEELKITKLGNQAVAFTVKISNFWNDFNICDTDETRLGIVKSYVCQILKQILRLDEDDEAIDENQKFSEMGMDSLMMLEMKNFLQTMLGSGGPTLNVSEMAELTTINKLSSHLLLLIKKSSTNNIDEEKDDVKESKVEAQDGKPPVFTPPSKELIQEDID